MTDASETKSDRTVAMGAGQGGRRSADAMEHRLFGDYELLEELGQGAMGVVYLARQRKADRVVALKVIRPDVLEGLSADKKQKAVERFRTEAQSAAQLEHDNIITVYDVGDVDGQPYFSMRYVEGESLSDLLRDGPLENRRAATYLESLARALHAAHRRGILHRDIKPQNVMVDVQADRALLADFGLAKLMEGESELTRDGEVMGTPQYMSPEQATDASTVTVQTDVYSLGATLYHLLTGQPPFQSVTALETLRQVMFDEPRPPRKIRAAVDADLETICLKCLEKERGRRYSTAEILADELERYLQGEPIQARPLGPLGRGWRWCRRNPVIAGLAVTAVTCLLVALFATTAGYLKTAQAHRESQRAYARAEESFRDARGAVNEFFVVVSEDQRLQQPGLQGFRKDLLEQALQYYMRFLEQRGDDPELRDEVATTYYRVGRITQEIESPQAALPWYNQALDIQRQRLTQESNPLEHLESLGDTRNAIGGAYHGMGNLDEALQAYAEAAELRKQLVEQDPRQAEYCRKLANSVMNMGVIAKDRGQPDEARRQMDEAQSLRLGQLERTPDAVDVRRDLGKGYYNLAILDFSSGNTSGAEQNLMRAVAAFEKLLEGNPEDADQQYRLAVCYRILADLSAGTDPQRAMSLYDKSRARLETILTGVPSHEAALAGLYLNLGDLHQRQNEPTTARRSFQRAIDVLDPLVTSSPNVPQYRRDYFVALRSIAVLQAQNGETQLACQNLVLAHRGFQTLCGQFADNADYNAQLSATAELLEKFGCPKSDGDK